MSIDRQLIIAILLAIVAWYFTHEPLPALVIGIASYGLQLLNTKL